MKTNFVTALANKKELIKKDLKDAIRLIHLTPDAWISENNLGLLGTVGHYISRNSGLHHSVRGLKRTTARTLGHG